MNSDMHDYLIAFHLTATRDEYRYLDFALTAMRAKPFTNSVVIVNTEKASSEIANELLGHLRPDDRLLVIRCDTSDSITRNSEAQKTVLRQRSHFLPRPFLATPMSSA